VQVEATDAIVVCVNCSVGAEIGGVVRTVMYITH